MKNTEIDEFTTQYIATALWSSVDENDEPLDANYTDYDLAPEALTEIVEDCNKFQITNAILINEALEDGTKLSTIGHDFWLTRNRHGTGFWDGDYEKGLGEKLTKAAHSFGECNMYVGDDGKLYIS